jgi:hypothetical protein
MQKLSLEYCHVTPGGDMSKEIAAANRELPGMLKLYDDFDIQKCIMVDDIHATEPADKKFLESLVSKLEVKPDCIYAESSLMKEAGEMVSTIDTKGVNFISSKEHVWLKESNEKYHSSKEFLLEWKNRAGDIAFSCPALAAASYLFRLGYIKGDGVQPLYGNGVVISDRVLNILSSQYLEVEADAQSLVGATFKEALGKMSWFFY